MFFLHALFGWASELEVVADRSELLSVNNSDVVQSEETHVIEQANQTFFEVPAVLPEDLGPLVVPKKSIISTENRVSKQYSSEESIEDTLVPQGPILELTKPWVPEIVPFLDIPIKHQSKVVPKDDLFTPKIKEELEHKPFSTKAAPAKMQAVDVHPKMPRIAILIDDLGYNRQGMKSALALPHEVALAILPETPFALSTALTAKEQNRITLLHAPMENQRELKLGPGGLYAYMTEHELKTTLKKDLDSLPGIQGVNNHMGSLLTTKADSMRWVMETLKGRSLFFIDSLTSPKSVAEKTAQEYGLKTVSRDVFLDNIRTQKAIDKQFSRLVKLARRHGSALAIGHPYPETMAYLKKRLNNLELDGVRLVRLSDVLEITSQPDKE